MGWKKAAFTIGAWVLAAVLLTGCLVRQNTVPGPGTPEPAAGNQGTEAMSGIHPELTGEPVRIGAVYSLSGNNAAIGTNILRGIDFAAEDINAAGGVDGRWLTGYR